MPSWAWVVTYNGRNAGAAYSFQCPLGLELLRHGTQAQCCDKQGFNALSGLYLISTNYRAWIYYIYNSSFNALSGLYLISTKDYQTHSICILKFQCPLGLIPHFYQIMYLVVGLLRSWVSMPSRAYTSFLRYPFKNLGFMRFPEPVFAGIYQNILTTAVFRAC